MTTSISHLQRLLVVEADFTEALANTRIAQGLQGARSDLLKQIRSVTDGGDLPLIVATERATVEGDLDRYANSRSMTSRGCSARMLAACASADSGGLRRCKASP